MQRFMMFLTVFIIMGAVSSSSAAKEPGCNTIKCNKRVQKKSCTTYKCHHRVAMKHVCRKGNTYIATSYGPPWTGIEGTGRTATGYDLRDGPVAYVVAVDPSYIRLGSKVRIWPNPHHYRGFFHARDTGSAIKGNKIDFYDWRGRVEQNAWGHRSVQICKG